jgi:hypothetical protein
MTMTTPMMTMRAIRFAQLPDQKSNNLYKAIQLLPRLGRAQAVITKWRQQP